MFSLPDIAANYSVRSAKNKFFIPQPYELLIKSLYLCTLFFRKNRFMRKLGYISPELSNLDFEVEAGFALSDDWGLPGETPESKDYGEF